MSELQPDDADSDVLAHVENLDDPSRARLFTAALFRMTAVKLRWLLDELCSDDVDHYSRLDRTGMREYMIERFGLRELGGNRPGYESEPIVPAADKELLERFRQTLMYFLVTEDRVRLMHEYRDGWHDAEEHSDELAVERFREVIEEYCEVFEPPYAGEADWRQHQKRASGLIDEYVRMHEELRRDRFCGPDWYPNTRDAWLTSTIQCSFGLGDAARCQHEMECVLDDPDARGIPGEMIDRVIREVLSSSESHADLSS